MSFKNTQNRVWAFLILALLGLNLFVGAAHAQGRPIDLSNFAYGLEADIHVSNQPLYTTPTKININADIRNSHPTNDYIIYLISNRNGTWITERIIGVAPAGRSTRFDFEFIARYSGSSYAKSQYALVASGDDVLLGKYFYVDENWRSYEKEQSDKISSFAQYAVPVAAAIVILIIVGIVRWAYLTKTSYTYEKEYTITSFFAPKLNGRPLKEVIADILINPVFWIFELLIMAVVLETVWPQMRISSGLETVILTFFAGILIPLVYFLLVWIYNNLVEKMPLRFLAGAFFWGNTAAMISLILNSAQARFLWQNFGLDQTMVVLITTAIVAPVIEEVAKGFGLLVMWGHHEFSDTLHGLHLGLAVGLGFSFVENWLYFSTKTQPLEMGLYAWLSIVIYRSFFNSIAHACFSGALGASLGWAKDHKWGGLEIVSFIPGLMTAVVLHSIFNITAIMDGFEALSGTFPVYRYNPTMIITLLSIMVVLLIGATIERRHGRRGVKKYTSYKEFKNK